MAIFRNPYSGFLINSIQLLPGGSGGGNTLTIYFYTIADIESLAPSRGYELLLISEKSVTAQVVSFTRVSLFKD